VRKQRQPLRESEVMNAIIQRFSTRRDILANGAILCLFGALPRPSYDQKGVAMPVPSTTFNGKIATMENLEEFALLGLRHSDPAAGWQRISFPNYEARLFSVAHPDGVPLDYDALLKAAETGLALAHPTYAGRSLQAACDGYGMIGAYVV